MNILVLNCGSSSIKFQIICANLEDIPQDGEQLLAKGVLERIGSQSLVTIENNDGFLIRDAVPLRDHKQAIDYILRWIINKNSPLRTIKALSDIHGVGHRVVHGGEKFQKSVRIDHEVLRGIEDCIELAPLHNPANLSGIRAVTELLGEQIPQVAVFDTAFHASMPPSAFLYAIPYQYYRRYGVRRYGFHGTSHRYIAYRYRRLLGVEKENVKIITIHLGNGCSICAIRGGQSIRTSMGMTPLEGLVMGTRSGDLDPAILHYLSHKEGLSFDDVDNVLNKQSGLLGISGLTNDMRELLAEEHENNDRRARLAIEIFCNRVKHYIGAYLAELDGADAVVFTGGIGENSAEIRSRICKDLLWLGIDLDEKTNNDGKNGFEGIISKATSRLKLMVIPTNEELLIARDTLRNMHT